MSVRHTEYMDTYLGYVRTLLEMKRVKSFTLGFEYRVMESKPLALIWKKRYDMIVFLETLDDLIGNVSLTTVINYRMNNLLYIKSKICSTNLN